MYNTYMNYSKTKKNLILENDVAKLPTQDAVLPQLYRYIIYSVR